MKSFGCIPVFSLKRLIRKLLIGLIFIHSKKVAHMDLQSHKIFIDSKNQLKIGGWFNKCQIFN
jgi:serine/threonine protein kinase